MSLEMTGAAFDSRKVFPGCLFAAFKGGNTDGHLYIPKAFAAGAACALVSQPCDAPAAVRTDDVAKALADAARGYRRVLNATVVGVTGSAGKTTTKELLARCLGAIGRTYATVGNNNNGLGLPVTILNTPRNAEFCVCEMGTNHPGEIPHLVSIARPDVGVITNIGDAHIEFFKSLDGTAREKGSLLAALPAETGFAVLDRNGVKYRELSRMAQCPVIDIGIEDRECEKLRKVLKSTLPGEHNVLNARLAEAVAMRLGASENDCLEVLAGFTPSGHRWRKTRWRGCNVLDDTYNANPESMVAALGTWCGESFAKGARRIAVIGRMGELGEATVPAHKKVAGFALSCGIDCVVFVDWPDGACCAGNAGTKIFNVPDAFAARDFLAGFVREGDGVFLKASRSIALERILV